MTAGEKLKAIINSHRIHCECPWCNEAIVRETLKVAAEIAERCGDQITKGKLLAEADALKDKKERG